MNFEDHVCGNLQDSICWMSKIPHNVSARNWLSLKLIASKTVKQEVLRYFSSAYTASHAFLKDEVTLWMDVAL